MPDSIEHIGDFPPQRHWITPPTTPLREIRRFVWGYFSGARGSNASIMPLNFFSISESVMREYELPLSEADIFRARLLPEQAKPQAPPQYTRVCKCNQPYTLSECQKKESPKGFLEIEMLLLFVEHSL